MAQKLTDSEALAAAIMAQAKEVGAEKAQRIIQPDQEVQRRLRELYQAGFIDGVLYLLQQELDNRIAERIMGLKDHEAAQAKAKEARRKKPLPSMPPKFRKV